jgi:hypothetical protein
LQGPPNSTSSARLRSFWRPQKPAEALPPAHHQTNTPGESRLLGEQGSCLGQQCSARRAPVLRHQWLNICHSSASSLPCLRCNSVCTRCRCIWRCQAHIPHGVGPVPEGWRCAQAHLGSAYLKQGAPAIPRAHLWTAGAPRYKPCKQRQPGAPLECPPGIRLFEAGRTWHSFPGGRTCGPQMHLNNARRILGMPGAPRTEAVRGWISGSLRAAARWVLLVSTSRCREIPAASLEPELKTQLSN